ncbi:hypothetical protein N7532_011287 [Penicillium argentinense]|uniref:Uncharacterized protein n=1 Tax=Penicillium argentinense TaxID=1131581 RepID=A0A9W9JUC1_9EURO|nr:uncharacterized protein N7532_011287 [Penicillium argentinense]KAJ5082244.1 hypothetical protein N7532_011287 [Penicillium argentinense]
MGSPVSRLRNGDSTPRTVVAALHLRWSITHQRKHFFHHLVSLTERVEKNQLRVHPARCHAYDTLVACVGTYIYIYPTHVYRRSRPRVLKYHTIVQTIFGVLKDLHKNEDADIDPDWENETRGGCCVSNALETAHLLISELWSLNRKPPVNIQWVTVSMFTLLPYLEDEENHASIISLGYAAKALSHRWSLGKGMMRLFQVTAKQLDVTFPPETNALIDELEIKHWRAEERRHFSSQYPNFANSMKRGEVDEIELDKFLAKLDDMYFKEREASWEDSPPPPPTESPVS